MSKTIYVTNLNGHDLSGAKEFGNGDVVPITKGKVNIFEMDALMRRIKIVMSDFSCDDYLLIAGNNVIASACVFIAKKYTSCVNILVYDARKNKYKLVKMED